MVNSDLWDRTVTILRTFGSSTVRMSKVHWSKWAGLATLSLETLRSRLRGVDAQGDPRHLETGAVIRGANDQLGTCTPRPAISASSRVDVGSAGSD